MGGTFFSAVVDVNAPEFRRCRFLGVQDTLYAAVNRAMPAGPGGFVFDHCKLTADLGVQGVALGRRVVFLNGWMGEHIRPEGWNNWGKPEAEKTAYFAEFGSEGPGAKEAERAKWAHSLASSEAEKFRAGVFLRGDDGWKLAAQ